MLKDENIHITKMNLNQHNDHKNENDTNYKTSTNNLHKIQIYTIMMTVIIPRAQHFKVLFHVMNFIYLDKLFQRGDIILSVIKLFLTNKHFIIMKVSQDNHNNNNDTINVKRLMNKNKNLRFYIERYDISASLTST